MGEFNLTSIQLRDFLQNSGKIKKDGICINCFGTGWENWNEKGEDVKSGRTSDENRCEGECEFCNGLGFIF